jgi:hypothetical protein
MQSGQATSLQAGLADDPQSGCVIEKTFLAAEFRGISRGSLQKLRARHEYRSIRIDHYLGKLGRMYGDELVH